MFLIVSRFEISTKKIQFFETAKVDDPLNAQENILLYFWVTIVNPVEEITIISQLVSY